MDEKEIQESLKRIADLDVQIKANIAEYNRLSGLANTAKRFALLTANSYMEDYDDEDEDDGGGNAKPIKTHDEYMEDRDCPPSPSVNSFGADAWFPSSICLGY
jgi:hypothetical protein